MSRHSLLRGAIASVFALSLSQCQSAPPAATDASTLRDAADGDDSGEAPGVARLDYQPEGCMHRVHTSEGTYGNYRGDRATFGANPAPRGVHVTWPADPATTAAFLWRTDPGTRASVVQLGTAPDALSRTVIGHASIGGTAINAAPMHEVHACGLTPDTTYYYRVGGEGHWSAVQSFKTAPAPGRTDYDVNFAVSGDSRDNPVIFRQVQEQMLRTSGMRQPDFEVFSGDAVFLGQIQGSWDLWFENAAPAMARMPFVLAHGNHDGLAINYLVQFAQPQADAPDQDELYFSMDYGPVHLVVLNDTPRGGDLSSLAGQQLTWLRGDLTRARMNRGRVPWIIVVHHKPCFGSSVHTAAVDTEFIRRTWPPVYDEFGVDIVFSGHEHDFELSKELDATGNEVSGRRGTLYMVAAGAGAELYEARQRAWTRYSESVVNFLLVHATNRALEVTPHRGDGTVITQGRVMLPPRPM
jgi:hypothetical protein